ncbi:hypothetical protein [Lentzea sp. NPDC059081]|uniref:hypothetical protein n=1 Tax=Lentzea sp. NPDC059081 TaxID=3346719 RepID=UPI0036A7C38B
MNGPGPGHECPASTAAALLVAGESWTDAVESAEQALADPACRKTPSCVSRALATLVCAGELVAADAHSLALLEDRSDDRVVEIALLARACVALRTGDLARCAALLDGLRHDGVTAEIRPVVLLWTVEDLVARGEPRGAETVLLAHDGDRSHPLLLAASAVVEMALGRPRDALKAHLACGRALTSFGVLNPAVLPWRHRAFQAASACGDNDDAARLAGEEHAAAARWGEPRALGLSLSAVARAGAPDGEDLVAYERSVRLLRWRRPGWNWRRSCATTAIVSPCTANTWQRGRSTHGHGRPPSTSAPPCSCGARMRAVPHRPATPGPC